MDVVDFVASPPREDFAMRKLQVTLERFKLIEEEIRKFGDSFVMSGENQAELADKTGVDRFMVEDVVDALLDQTSSISSEFIGRGFWTLGRRTPRYGTPWGDLVFYETSECAELLVRYGGSFDDEEDPPTWINCPLVSTGGVPYQKLTTLAANCGTLDIWWKLHQNTIIGKLVFN